MKRVLVVGVSLAWVAGQVLGAGSFEAAQKALGIPSSEGTVVDASGSRPAVILIQDIHRHPEAQQHIRAMIVSLMHWGAKDLLLEGAWADGQLQDLAFKGLEDPEIYRANVAAYETVEKVREDALREIDTAQMFENAFDAASQPTSWAQVKRLLQLRLKPGEYAEYLQHPYRQTTDSPLARGVEAAERFYELANQRSDIFLSRAKECRQEGPQILVVGGFHTTAMAETLRQEHVPFVVLAPRVTQGGYEELYSQGMHQTISALKLH